MAARDEGRRRQLLMEVANFHRDPTTRAKAAEHYREAFGDDAPPMSGPLPADQKTRGDKPLLDPPQAAGAGRQQGPGWLANAANWVGGQAEGAARAVLGSTGLMDHTPESARRGEEVDAFMQRANERYTFGAWPVVQDALGLSSPGRRAQLEKENPRASVAGGVTGDVVGAIRGPAALVDKAVTTTAAQLPRVGNALASSLPGRVATNAASGATTAALSGEDIEGQQLGAGLGAAGTLAGTALKAGARGLRAVSPWVDDFAEARASGILKAPEIRDLPGGPRGVKLAAEGSFERIVEHDAALVGAQKDKYRAAIEPFLASKIDRTKAFDVLNRQYLANLDPRNGAPYDDVLDAAYRDAFDYLGGLRPKGGGHAPGGKPGFTYTANEPEPDLLGMMKQTQSVRNKAGFESLAPSPSNVANRQVLGAYKAAIDASAPAPVVSARSEAADAARGARRRRDLLLRTEGEITRPTGERAPSQPAAAVDDDEISGLADELGPPSGARAPIGEARPAGDMRVQKKIQGTRLLQRVGDTNVPGIEAASALEELALDPVIERELRLIRAKKAAEAVQPSLKALVPTDLAGTNEMGGWGGFVRQNSRAAAAHLLEPGLRGGGAALERAAPRLAPLFVDPVDAILNRRR